MIPRNPTMKGARHCRAPIRIAELDLQSRQHYASIFTFSNDWNNQLHPVVDPHVLHFKQVPLRTSVKFPHSPQLSPT